jgi:hypothetical protein
LVRGVYAGTKNEDAPDETDGTEESA